VYERQIKRGRGVVDVQTESTVFKAHLPQGWKLPDSLDSSNIRLRDIIKDQAKKASLHDVPKFSKRAVSAMNSPSPRTNKEKLSKTAFLYSKR